MKQSEAKAVRQEDEYFEEEYDDDELSEALKNLLNKQLELDKKLRSLAMKPGE